MEKLKSIFARIFSFRKSKTEKVSEEPKYDHIVTIEEVDGRTEISRTTPAKPDKMKKQRRFGFLVDFLFCALVTLLWVTAFSFFVRFGVAAHSDKINAHEYFYFSYFIVVVIVSVTGIHFESLILKGFEKFTPRVAIVVKKNQPRPIKNYILRMRVVGDREFIETELHESKLNLSGVLDVCCHELTLDRNQIVYMLKVPDTKIRCDNDVKRFRRLEYVEVLIREC